MSQPIDTSAIQRLIAGTRFRIRAQWALEGATTATVLAAALALVSIFAVRTQAIAPATGMYLLVIAGALIAIGAIAAATRKLDDELVARRIDRASNLADRLSTAIAFERVLRGGAPADPDTTHDLMHAAIRDGVKAAPRANIRAAAPFSPPKDLRAALGFLAVSALAAGLSIPATDRTPHLLRANPDRERPGAVIFIEGKHLMTGVAAPLAALPTASSIGAPNVPAGATARDTSRGYVPSDTTVTLGTETQAMQIVVLDWTASKIKVRIPDDAPIGPTELHVYVDNRSIGAVEFEVADKKDKSLHDEKAVALDPDEKAYVEAILAELKSIAQRDQVPELEEFAHKIEQLLDKAENGEISKEELLDALSKAEDAMKQGMEPNEAEVKKQLADMGKELKKSDVTKELGQALEKNDLQKAKEELEKLAEKLDKKELSDKQKQELGKQLEKVAQQMEKQDQEQKQKTDQAQQKLEKEIRRLEKQKQEAKNDRQRQEMERRLEEKKRELQKLQKKEEQKQQSEQRRAVKRLQKDLEKAAENLQKPQKDPNQQGQDQEQQDQQASQKLKDAARETGRVDRDQRKQAAQKKTSSQMDDLREAMRRAKQRGNKGPNDPFNKQGKNQDFISRARGQQGQKGAWKPGQGQGQGQGKGQGQGQGQNGGQGQGSGQGSGWGVGHDDNLAGDPTQKSGNTHDEDLQGTHGNEGGSTRETILSAAQKGFASKRYQKVYQDYQRIVEEVMRTEKLPSSYKYYVKRYFAKIHPSMNAEGNEK